EKGEPRTGDTVLLLLNAHHESIPFRLPIPVESAEWEPLMDTAQFPGRLSDTKGGTEYELHARSMALLRLTTPTKREERKEGYVAAEITQAAAPLARSPET